jgi:phosphoglycolate phosphatase
MPSNKSEIYDGVKEALQTLFERGYKMAVLSNKPHDLTLECARLFLPEFHFHSVFGEIRGVERKPDPIGALNIAKELSLLPDEFAFVGDTKTDMQTAKNADMHAIGVTWGFRDRAELEENGANAVIDKPSELILALEKR